MTKAIAAKTTITPTRVSRTALDFIFLSVIPPMFYARPCNGLSHSFVPYYVLVLDTSPAVPSPSENKSDSRFPQKLSPQSRQTSDSDDAHILSRQCRIAKAQPSWSLSGRIAAAAVLAASVPFFMQSPRPAARIIGTSLSASPTAITA